MNLKFGFLLFSLLILINCTEKTVKPIPPKVSFIKLGGDNDDEARDIISKNNYLYTIGSTSSKDDPNGDIHFLKLDAEGNVLLEKTYGGSGQEIGIRLTSTYDDHFILIGSTQSKGAGKKDIWVIKMDTLGNVLWDRTFGGSEDDTPADVIQLKDGKYLVAGTTESFGAGSRDMYVLRLDESGNLDNTFNGNGQWVHGGEDVDGCSQVMELDDHQWMVFGYTKNFGATSRDFYLLNIQDRLGSINIKASQRFGGSEYEESHAMIRDYAGNYILHGHSASTEINHNMYTVVVSRQESFQQGVQLVEQKHFNYGGAMHDGGQAITINTEREYIMIGRSMSFSSTRDIIFTRISADGKPLEYTEFDEGNNEYPYDIVELNNHYYIVGFTQRLDQPDTDMLLVKVRK
jgi:hypothetical protein